MVRKKKKEKPTTIPCPIRGHSHNLELMDHPDRDDLVIARCGRRDVYQAPKNPARPVEPAVTNYSYKVPSFSSDDSKDKGE